MIQRALRLKQGLDHVTGNLKDLRPFEVQDEEWNLLGEVMSFLEPFAVTTQHIEGFKYPTLSSVIPLYNKLLDILEDHIKRGLNKPKEILDAAKSAHEKLMKYYEKTTPVYLAATVLDPRLKLIYFQENGFEEGNDEAGGENLIETRIIPG